eukprot:CAMPEP_0170489990 /NCGR_PEP_ID=MMETSP0208-20121228/8277_1 /TAXON_ID=197538 /ORGANISM="Strombidium inclinatum, Strain S3" /LENGTH=71 /DNA_ID=CAMNT_0010765179 /DNA_START=76 /DNA_END=291 /DNA_ORIENTATION=-
MNSTEVNTTAGGASNLRDKSIEKKQAQGQRDKELMRTRKTLREREKELVKLKQEIVQIKKDSQEKQRTDNQ